jgi:hypothetical protein
MWKKFFRLSDDAVPGAGTTDGRAIDAVDIAYGRGSSKPRIAHADDTSTVKAR